MDLQQTNVAKPAELTAAAVLALRQDCLKPGLEPDEISLAADVVHQQACSVRLIMKSGRPAVSLCWGRMWCNGQC